MLLFVPPERQKAVRERLRGLIHVPFKFEFQGSQIIFCDREEEYLAEEYARRAEEIRPFRELSGDEMYETAGTAAGGILDRGSRE